MGVIILEGRDERLVQRDPTQKLCVRLDSIVAAVRDRDDGRYHLMLRARERQVGRHERAECGEGVEERVGDEAVRGDDAGGPVGRGVDRRRVFLWIQRLLCLDGMAQLLIRLGERNCANPGHQILRLPGWSGWSVGETR